MLEDYLSEQQAADMLGAKVQTLRAWAARRKGPARCKVGKRVLYRKAALVAWLEQCEVDPAAARREAYRQAPAAA
ncbi:MAG: helix-turn-helix domain-containing protein [Rhodospirillales bacterium]|jgi:excisionase family DNA binding protein|nr:helix-turn-helix domain-containing protein [Rhodospirillales bacterium]